MCVQKAALTCARIDLKELFLTWRDLEFYSNARMNRMSTRAPIGTMDFVVTVHCGALPRGPLCPDPPFTVPPRLTTDILEPNLSLASPSHFACSTMGAGHGEGAPPTAEQSGPTAPLHVIL